MPELTDAEIIGRVRFSDHWIKPFRDNDKSASDQYIDANGSTAGGTEDDWDDELGQTFRDQADVPDAVPIGQPNYMAINTEVSSAAVSSQIPKLHVQANEDVKKEGWPNAAAIVQGAWQQTWVNGGFKRVMRGAWQKRKICGLGCVWYRWDENYGFVIENVTSNRFFFDPHATNLRRLRYAGVAVNMPLSEAIRKYDPDNDEGWFNVKDNESWTAQLVGRVKEALSFRGKENDETGAAEERNTCRIYIYFDRETECHVYNDQVIFRKENLYKTIPLHFRGLFIDPRDRILPLGMNVFARGLNQALVWLTAIGWNTAKNGAEITLFDANVIKGQTRTAVENGSASQLIGIDTPLNKDRPPIIRIPGAQLPPAYGQARSETQAALDGIMGSSGGMRGESPPGVTATAAMLSESRSNAMMVDEQFEYEEWCSDVATSFVMCTQMFGGPEKGKDTPTAATALWHAFCAVHAVKVVNGSTSFSNPATELQSSMQLFTTIVQAHPLFVEYANKGIMDKIPNLEAIFNDLLVASNRSNLEEYWKPAPPPPQGPSTIPVDVVKFLQANYANAPADVQRQMEQMMGMQPSNMPPQQDDGGAAAGQATAQLQAHMEALKLQHKTAEQQSDHQHDYRKIALETAKEVTLAHVKADLAPKEIPVKTAAKKGEPK